MIKKIAAAFEFLTIIPLPLPKADAPVWDESSIGKSSSVFPIVGLIIGGAYLLCFIVLRHVLPASVCAVVVITLGAVITGGLHLDGVSDTFDALAAKRTPAERLSIMKSGSAGPIGVAAVVLTLLMKYALVKELLSNAHISSAFILLTYPAAGRFAATAAMFTGKSAKPEGLGWVFIEHTGVKEFMAASGFSFIILTVLNIYLNNGGGALCASFHSIAIIILITLAARISGAFFLRRFGGLTGDTIGAFIEGSELMFLLYSTIITGGAVCQRGFI
ncbi:adenosylcobinamide-GDP ribazoletransferase [Candidatus Magnetominusculus dajiuhuensis]|uniref:adenosylcobinamide-GDP ribazoletransferase n=1 Tax=Candidatus Magnetominusculus dajiuhuensis TaxID=3137712 RepID=UPI003B435A76